MRNKRKISLANCNFNFQDENCQNTNEVKTIASNSFGAVQLQENLRTAKQASGITLIALVVTIVVLLILAGVSISTVLGNNGIIPRANEAKFKTDLANIQEEFNLYVTDKTAENSDFSVGSLNASSDLLTYNTQPDEEKGTGNIRLVLKSSAAQKYIQSKSFSIIKGDLIYASQNAKELEWAQEVGLAINPYNIDENGVLLSSETNLMLMDKATGTLVIPEMVTSIGEGTFGVVEGLKKVVIPPTVKEIQSNAFSKCTSLEEVVFETKMGNGTEVGTEKIGAYAFDGCRNLKSLKIPDTVRQIGNWAFRSCSSLTSIELPMGLISIAYGLLEGCRSLTTIMLPGSVRSIGSYAFYCCEKLRVINIPADLEEIGSGCFGGCLSLENIDVDRGNMSFVFEDNILFNIEKTSMIWISPKAIPDTQTTFTIPDGITELSLGLIDRFNSLSKIVIPASMGAEINYIFFPNWITEIAISDENPNLMADRGAIYSKDKQILYYYYKPDAHLQIDDSVTEIGRYAFKRCSNITSLTIGKNVTYISFDWVWAGSASFSSVVIDNENKNYMVKGSGIYMKSANGEPNTLVAHFGKGAEFDVPEGVTGIGAYALARKCLSKITLPSTVKDLGNSAFDGASITKIKIPNSVENIGASVFANCNKLVKIEIDKEKNTIAGASWGCPVGERAIIWLR